MVGINEQWHKIAQDIHMRQDNELLKEALKRERRNQGRIQGRQTDTLVLLYLASVLFVSAVIVSFLIK